MRVPVMLVVPGTDEIRASSVAAMSDGPTRPQPLLSPSYPNFTVDPGFNPVPVGARNGMADRHHLMLPHHSPHFAIRGTLESDGAGPPHAVDGAEVYSDPRIAAFVVNQESPAVGDAADVRAKLRVPDLQRFGMDGKDVAVAVLDLGINLAYLEKRLGRAVAFDKDASWRPGGPDDHEPGAWPVAHGTMCAYDVLLGAPAATLIDAPVLTLFDDGGGSKMSGTLSAALAAIGKLLTGWSTGGLSSYKALVINNSWGIYNPSWDFPVDHPGRYCDNPRHPFNIQVGAASRMGIDLLFAAGNCGAESPGGRCQGRTSGTIMGAGAMADVLTVAGCDTIDRRVGYSSQGPSIAGMYPQKPDITTYTHFAGSEALGQGAVDGGTSAACPVATGCVAALRSSKAFPPRSAVPPAKLFDLIRQTARPAGGPAGAWNGDYGFGILDPVAVAEAGGVDVTA